VLADDVLLEIFDFYLEVNQAQDFYFGMRKGTTMEWTKLVHVCQRWRYLVFQSPRRLGLQISCTGRTPVKEMLDIWPALPLIVWVAGDGATWSRENTIAALKHRDRICGIRNDDASLPLETLLPMMQEAFPALITLDLESHGEMAPVADSFLGGSAPHLRYLCLRSVPFAALPKLLLSATDLVDLHLCDIPDPGYISPEAMVTTLSALATLESFSLEFQSPRSRSSRESRHPLSPKCVVLPALIYFYFEGVSEYLEDLMAPIGAAPRLDHLEISFFGQPIFHTPHLSRFISRNSKIPGTP
jgi:hypothetical protein